MTPCGREALTSAVGDDSGIERVWCSPKPKKSGADLFREVDGFEHVPDRLRGRSVAAVVSVRGVLPIE